MSPRAIVERNLARSARFGGAISGRGPRYCPSIEDKVVRFPNARRHQVFLEPEGLNTTELYVNGLSTSLPPDVQLQLLRSIPGLEDACMTRVGYAIEYDYFPPHQLRHSLEVRELEGLFFAGQINGTTGYEEAAAQGVVAGVNAALRTQGRGPWVLERDQAYIGVLIDDLVTKGVDEPYRLFTSRAEFRLLLRQDNAVRRLGPLARRIGLLTSRQQDALQQRLEREDRTHEWFRETALAPDRVNAILEDAGSRAIHEPVRAAELLKRPGVSAEALFRLGETPAQGSLELLAAVEVDIKYEGYVERERVRAERVRGMREFEVPRDLPYESLVTLSREAREKLSRVRPGTLAQAQRVPGVSPADLQNLVLEVRWRRAGQSGAGEGLDTSPRAGAPF